MVRTIPGGKVATETLILDLQEYLLKIQSPSKSNEANMVTIAVAKIDMARLISVDQTSQRLVLPLSF